MTATRNKIVGFQNQIMFHMLQKTPKIASFKSTEIVSIKPDKMSKIYLKHGFNFKSWLILLLNSKRTKKATTMV